MSTPMLCNIPTAVAETGISRSGLYDHIKAGRITVVKLGRRTYIARDELERFVGQLIADADIAQAKAGA